MSAHPRSDTDITGFDALYGLELTECSEELTRGRVAVGEELRQRGGVLHGGVYAAVADALAVRGTVAGLADEGKLAVGLANQTSVLHPLARGAIHATAVRRHRGRTTWVWEVEIAGDDGHVSAVSRVTVAVRDREGH
jgi:1,4-dihydroxy-2-naphthoyl-CoA hydrolase